MSHAYTQCPNFAFEKPSSVFHASPRAIWFSQFSGALKMAFNYFANLSYKFTLFVQHCIQISNIRQRLNNRIFDFQLGFLHCIGLKSKCLYCFILVSYQRSFLLNFHTFKTLENKKGIQYMQTPINLYK